MAQCTGNPCLLLTALLLAVFLVEALTYIFFGPRVSFMVSFPCVVLAFLCSAVCCGCKPREPSNSHAVQQQHRYSQTVAPSAAPAAAVEALALPAAGAAAAFARSGSEVVCAICLGVLLAGEMVRQLPACKHMFHDECVAAWLQSHSTCPLCRAEASPKAAAGKEKAGDGEAASSPRPRPRPPV